MKWQSRENVYNKIKMTSQKLNLTLLVLLLGTAALVNCNQYKPKSMATTIQPSGYGYEETTTYSYPASTIASADSYESKPNSEESKPASFERESILRDVRRLWILMRLRKFSQEKIYD